MSLNVIAVRMLWLSANQYLTLWTSWPSLSQATTSVQNKKICWWAAMLYFH